MQEFETRIFQAVAKSVYTQNSPVSHGRNSGQIIFTFACYPRFRASFSSRWIFISTETSIPVLQPKKPPIKLYLGSFRNDRSVKLTIHLHRVQRFRMGGGIPLLPLYAFMAWT